MDPFKTLVLGTPPSRTFTGSAVGLLTAANNLSDVADAQTALNNLTSTTNINLAGATSSIVLGAATETLTIAVTAAGAGTITPKSGQVLTVVGSAYAAKAVAGSDFLGIYCNNTDITGTSTIRCGYNANLSTDITTNTDGTTLIQNRYDDTASAIVFKLKGSGTPVTALTLASTGVATLACTTDSSSKDTGALIVEGGVGVEKSVTIGGALSVVNTAGINVAGTGFYIGDVIGANRVGFGILASGTYELFNSSNGYAPLKCGAATLVGAITTAAPTTGTAGAWKLGIRVAATTTLDTTQYIQLDVGGTLYKLAVVTT